MQLMEHNSNRVIRPFRRMRKSTCMGIDIGTHSLKIAEVSRQGPEFVIERATVVPHRVPLELEDWNGCLATIANSLDEVWAPSGRWLADEAACVLPCSWSQFRNLELPRASAAEWQHMASLELTEEMGETPREWIVDCWETHPLNPQGELASVSAIGFRRRIVLDVLDLLLRRGLACQTIDALPFTLWQAAIHTSSTAGRSPFAILNWGYETALLTVGDRRGPLYHRILRGCAFRRVIDAVCGEFAVEHREAEQLACRHDFGGPAGLDSPSDEIGNALLDIARGPFADFQGELRRTIEFLRTQMPDILPESIVLTGGGAMCRGVVPLIMESAGLPATVWEFPSQVSHPDSNISAHPLLSSAIALSIQGLAS